MPLCDKCVGVSAGDERPAAARWQSFTIFRTIAAFVDQPRRAGLSPAAVVVKGDGVRTIECCVFFFAHASVHLSFVRRPFWARWFVLRLGEGAGAFGAQDGARLGLCYPSAGPCCSSFCGPSLCMRYCKCIQAYPAKARQKLMADITKALEQAVAMQQQESEYEKVCATTVGP